MVAPLPSLVDAAPMKKVAAKMEVPLIMERTVLMLAPPELVRA